MDDTDLSDLPVMSEPSLDFGENFSDWSSDTINEPSAWSSIWDAISSPTAKQLISAGSGLYGLYQSGQQLNLAKEAMKKSDPFGPYRAHYAQQLMSLMSDPSKLAEEPGYKFQFNQGATAVERLMASKGYLGSGNEGIALTEYGQGFANKYLDDRINQLAGLAGANISPNYGPGLTGYASGLDTASAALASLGYAVGRGGASAGTPASHPNAAGGEAAGLGSTLSAAGSTLGTANKVAGVFGSGSEAVGTAAKDLVAAGSIYSGIQQGGVGGYLKAAQGAGTLYGQLSSLGSGTAAAEGAAGGTAGAAGAAGSGALSTMSALGMAAGIYTGWKSLTTKEGKFGGTVSGAEAGYEIGGPWGALIGGAIGYTAEGGYKDAAPYDAAGFSGTTMDQAWRDQNVLRLASNPAAAIASKWLGVSSKSTLGKILDPAAAFERHGDEKRNFNAFSDAFPGIKDLGHGMWQLPDGKQITGDQIQWLAGTWYGATYHPDGDQAGWQAKFEKALKDIYG